MSESYAGVYENNAFVVLVDPTVHIEGLTDPQVTAEITNIVGTLRSLEYFQLTKVQPDSQVCCGIPSSSKYKIVDARSPTIAQYFTFGRRTRKVNCCKCVVDLTLTEIQIEPLDGEHTRVLAETTSVDALLSSEVKINGFSVGEIIANVPKNCHYTVVKYSTPSVQGTHVIIEPTFGQTCSRNCGDIKSFGIYLDLDGETRQLVGEIKYDDTGACTFNMGLELDPITKTLLVMASSIIYDQLMQKHCGRSIYWITRKMFKYVLIAQGILLIGRILEFSLYHA